jgi:predicted DNA-binding transcriptional regulator AlpA
MDEASDQSISASTPALLDGWLTRPRVAEEIGVSVDTLQRWETARTGPPCVRIGRKVLYRADAFREWLISRERAPTAGKMPRSGVGR